MGLIHEGGDPYFLFASGPWYGSLMAKNTILFKPSSACRLTTAPDGFCS